MSRHVEALLSAAYDGELSPDARAAFDRHLGECSACAAAFAELTTAVDALREQPPARMPHPVRLPEGSPAPEHRRFGLPAWLPPGGRLVTGLAAAGVVAAAGVAAVVVVGHLNPGVVNRYSSSNAGVSGPIPAPLPEYGPDLGSMAAGNAAAGVCPSQLAGTDATSAAAIPAGFPNHTTEDDGATKAVIATQASGYTPGATVDVYARLIDDSTGAVSLPCTLLAGPEAAGSSAALAVPATETSASPAGTLTFEGQPVFAVVVPGTAVAGTTYQIVVEVPAGPGKATAKQVTLSIRVT